MHEPPLERLAQLRSAVATIVPAPVVVVVILLEPPAEVTFVRPPVTRRARPVAAIVLAKFG